MGSKSRAMVLAVAAVTILFATTRGLFHAPVPPPPTGPGISPEFDAHLRDIDSRFEFVFADPKQIVLTRMDGAINRVPFDLRRHAHLANANIWDVRLSPDFRAMLVSVSDGPWNAQDSRKLLLVDLASGDITPVAVPQGDFQFDMSMGNQSLIHWITARSFVISLTHYPPGGAHLFKKKFLKYELDRLASPTELSLNAHRPTFVLGKHNKVYFVGDNEPSPGWKIHAIADGEFRDATKEERIDFDTRYFGGADGPQKVLVDKVLKGEPMFGSDRDWKRFDIYLSGKWVRRSDDPLQYAPSWDDELSLYIWHENFTDSQTYFMDRSGRYRAWYQGVFVGKIPRATTHAPSLRQPHPSI